MDPSNSVCFERISLTYEEWLDDKGPGFDPFNTANLIMVCVVLLGVSWKAGAPLLALGVVICGFILSVYCYEEQVEWASLIDNELNKYQPVNIDAFIAFQQSVKATGQLEKETLGRWIETERNARLKRSTSGATFTERDLNSVKREDSA